MRFEGKTALVTGARRGIGLAIAERLLGEGARVALVDQDAEVEAVAKRLGPSARGLIADVTRTADVDRAVDAAYRWADRLDIVVNNAGITGRSYPIWELTDEDWHQVLAVDLTSVFLVCRAAVRLMRPRRQGRIINIASIAGKEGNPTPDSVFERQGRRHRPHQGAGKGSRHSGHSGTRSCPRRHRDRAAPADDEGDRGHAGRQDSDGPGRHPGRGGHTRRVACLRRVRVHDRRRARPLRRPCNLSLGGG